MIRPSRRCGFNDVKVSRPNTDKNYKYRLTFKGNVKGAGGVYRRALRILRVELDAEALEKLIERAAQLL